MKPQKRSIRDFFSPASQSSPATQKPDTSSARASSSTSSTVNTPTEPSKTHTSTATHASHISHATSPDVQPPPASQNSANSGSSKRTVSKGEQVVLNSDSDTDSLPDLDWGGPTINVKTSTPTTYSKRSTEDIGDGLRRPERKDKRKKRPIDQVIEVAQKNQEVERIISEHKAHLERQVEEASAPKFVLNEDTLGQAIKDNDDPEKAHRLLLAMQRTNATEVERVFHFFSSSSCADQHPSLFPGACLPKQRWASVFRDAPKRDQAFLTGFAHQVFRLQELPEDLASWMIDEITCNRNDTLALKYMEILEAHNHFLNNLLDRKRIEHIFKSIGADMKVLSSDAELIQSIDAHSERPDVLPVTLKSIARLLERAAPRLRTKARSYAFYILCHTCMDNRVLNDPGILGTIQDAIEAVVCNFSDNQKLVLGLNDVFPQLVSQVAHPILQRDLICALPAQTPLTAYLRRHLALSFLLHPQIVDVPLADPGIPALIHRHLKSSSSFHINKKTNYAHLAARMTLLDIAIGPGLLSVPYQPLVSPPLSQAGSSPIMAPFPASDEIKDFNRVIDVLAQNIKLLGNSIVESGAVVDLTILEAKDSVERLSSRLEHAVRIGGKKSHNVFGDDEEDKQLRVTDIFRRAAKLRKSETPVGIFDNDDVTDDDRAVAAQIEAEISLK